MRASRKTQVQGWRAVPLGGFGGERGNRGGGAAPWSGVWGRAPSRMLQDDRASGRAEVRIGEIVTPWRLEDYARSLDEHIKLLNAQIAQSGKVPGEIADVPNGFDVFGFLTWIANWQKFYGEMGIVDEWYQPGATYNVVERYHFEYIDWRKRAIARGLVGGPDPMPKPRPYEEPGPIIPPVFGPKASDIAPWFGLALLGVGGYFLSSLAANRRRA
jgi:hypothetical protein